MIKKKEESKTKKSDTLKKTVKKDSVKSAIKKEIRTKKEVQKDNRYIESIGKRKTSIARVRMFIQGKKELLINDKPYKSYFPVGYDQQIVLSPLEKMKCLNRFQIVVKVKGGGAHSQAEAIRHGIARALVDFNPNFRKRLRRAGFLTRDSRVRERKKFGLKRARRAPQWRKR